VKDLVNGDLSKMNGSRLGELESKLDATLCAYVAAWLHLRGPTSCAFLGDLTNGYVLLPTPDEE
jgi:predicted RNase H-like nuclease